jgi:UDP-glucose:(heptosyl)LPS alpha-1,3-glucosyltransferase
MALRLAVNYRCVDPRKGGAETYVADLCRRLAEAGHMVHLYADRWAEGVLPPGVECVRVPAPGRTESQRIWSFAENSEAALRSARHDCSIGLINTWYHDVLIPQGGVHGASLEANARRFPPGWRRALYVAAKRANPRSRLYRAIEHRQYDPRRGARTIIAVSRMVRGHLERFHGVQAERVRVVPNAIDAGRLRVADPAATRRQFRAAQGIGRDELVALFVGHNFRLKGLAPLLHGLRARLDANPSARPIRLLACGGGRLDPFRRLARRLGLGETVRLLGFIPDARAAFHASDFFVLPTYYDPCSLVVFEALACGLPVITTSCNGAGELITTGREGFVIPTPDDLPRLVQALERMTDDDARSVMSRQAVALGEAQSFENHVAKLLDVFESVARRKQEPSPAGRHATPVGRGRVA